MNWKEKLNQLEKKKKWDEAINFMQNVIRENAEDMDAYLCLNYLLMNLLVEEEYDNSQQENYWNLAKWYFKESYEKFKHNPEYLYITGKTAAMSEWFFGLDWKQVENMLNKARALAPENPTYNEHYFWDLEEKDPRQPEVINYAQLILRKDSPIATQLKSKGAVGQYLLELKYQWAKKVLDP